MTESKLRVAVLGAGKWAEEAHIPGWIRDPRSEIVAICDPILERAEHLPPGSTSRNRAQTGRQRWRATMSTSSMLRRPLGRTSTSPGRRWKQGNTSSVRNQSRPTTARLAAPQNFARSKGLKTKLGFTFRYSPGVRYAWKLIRDGFVGTPFIFNGYDQNSQWLDPETPLRQVDVNADPNVIQVSSLEGYGASIMDIGHWWVGADYHVSSAQCTTSFRSGGYGISTTA